MITHGHSIPSVAPNRLSISPLELQHQVLGKSISPTKPNNLSILISVLLLLESIQMFEHSFLNIPNTFMLDNMVVPSIWLFCAESGISG